MFCVYYDFVVGLFFYESPNAVAAGIRSMCDSFVIHYQKKGASELCCVALHSKAQPLPTFVCSERCLCLRIFKYICSMIQIITNLCLQYLLCLMYHFLYLFLHTLALTFDFLARFPIFDSHFLLISSHCDVCQSFETPFI